MLSSPIFFNSFGRLRSGWRFAIFCAILFILIAISATLVNLFFDFPALPLAPNVKFALAFVFQFVALLLSAVAAGWICAKWFEELPFKSLGLNLRAGWLRDLMLGFVVGALSLLLAALFAALGGGLSLSLNQTASYTEIARTILISLVIFGLGAASEEALFRGYPLQTFARARLIWVALLITSTVFALAHATNPNATRLGLFNTALAGVWFVVAYSKTRTLWFPFGLHWSWNWTMGAILGVPVSGIEQLTPNPVFVRADQGPAWLTGGGYGLEGGAACTLALIVSTILIWFAPFLKSSAEMLALTNQENPKRQTYELPPSPPIFHKEQTEFSSDNAENL